MKASGTEENKISKMSLCKWLVEQGLGEISKRQTLLRATKDRKWRVEGENHDCPRS